MGVISFQKYENLKGSAGICLPVHTGIDVGVQPATFLGLSSDRAYKRCYPAIDPLISWSRYITQLEGWFAEHMGPQWIGDVRKMQELLRRGDSIYPDDAGHWRRRDRLGRLRGLAKIRAARHGFTSSRTPLMLWMRPCLGIGNWRGFVRSKGLSAEVIVSTTRRRPESSLRALPDSTRILTTARPTPQYIDASGRKSRIWRRSTRGSNKGKRREQRHGYRDRYDGLAGTAGSQSGKTGCYRGSPRG